MQFPDTIFALSSGKPPSGVAVIRISGRRARTVVHAVAGSVPVARKAELATLRSAQGETVDRGLALFFPGPASFTGEDCAEFHVHGGRAVVSAMLAALSAFEGLRPAEAGEFTRRAVENGKFDLTQAEALADLINAETEAQRRQALRQYGGALTALYEGWRTELIGAAAWAEAAIDFSDEELPADIIAKAKVQAVDVADKIRAHLNDARRGEILREGFHLTVIGPPNSGKSSLVNALAQRDVAIVSEVAGTTRDVLEVHLDLDGYPVIVADTAGLRETGDAVESEGVRRAVARAGQADAVLLLLEATAADAGDWVTWFGDKPVLTVWNKTDLPHPERRELAISVRTGAGMDELLAQIGHLVQETLATDSAAPLSRARHRHTLTQAEQTLTRALSAGPPELFAEELRMALRHLGRMTGRVDVEDLLDVIFGDFCIGK
jgi:tRNA modification GTPase